MRQEISSAAGNLHGMPLQHLPGPAAALQERAWQDTCCGGEDRPSQVQHQILESVQEAAAARGAQQLAPGTSRISCDQEAAAGTRAVQKAPPPPPPDVLPVIACCMHCIAVEQPAGC